MSTDSQIETFKGTNGVLLPAVSFDDLRPRDPISKVLNIFRLFAEMNELIEPFDDRRGVRPAFDYEMVVPGDTKGQLAVVRGVRSRFLPSDEEKHRTSLSYHGGGRSRGYKVADEKHELLTAPLRPGPFYVAISVSYREFQGGWASGGASVPASPIDLILDRDLFSNIDRDDELVELGARNSYARYYELLGIK